jgi:hypothetical protein
MKQNKYCQCNQSKKPFLYCSIIVILHISILTFKGILFLYITCHTSPIVHCTSASLDCILLWLLFLTLNQSFAYSCPKFFHYHHGLYCICHSWITIGALSTLLWVHLIYCQFLSPLSHKKIFQEQSHRGSSFTICTSWGCRGVHSCPLQLYYQHSPYIFPCPHNEGFIGAMCSCESHRYR